MGLAVILPQQMSIPAAAVVLEVPAAQVVTEMPVVRVLLGVVRKEVPAAVVAAPEVLEEMLQLLALMLAAALEVLGLHILSVEQVIPMAVAVVVRVEVVITLFTAPRTVALMARAVGVHQEQMFLEEV